MTVRRSRLLTAVLAASVVLGLTIAPAVAADAAGTTTGTIKVQLVGVSGADKHVKSVVIIAQNQKSGSSEIQRKTNASGTATFKVATGKYTFTVATYLSAYQYAPSTQKNIKIVRGQSKIIGAKFIKGGVVSGKVTKPTGGALAKATVAAVDAKGIVRGSTQTDKHGKYILRGLPTGTYRIEFNQRSGVDFGNPAVTHYGWSYYGKKIKVYAQNKYADETWTKGVSGSVHTGVTLHITLTQPGTASTIIKVDRLTSGGAYNPDGSVYPQVKNGTTVSIKVMPGHYRLSVAYNNSDKLTYLYAGYSTPDAPRPLFHVDPKHFDAAANETAVISVASTEVDKYVLFGPLQ